MRKIIFAIFVWLWSLPSIAAAQIIGAAQYEYTELGTLVAANDTVDAKLPIANDEFVQVVVRAETPGTSGLEIIQCTGNMHALQAYLNFAQGGSAVATSGQIVGEQPGLACIDNNKTVKNIGPQDTKLTAFGVNDGGVVAGEYRPGGEINFTDAFLCQNDAFCDFNNLASAGAGGDSETTDGFNIPGHIVGIRGHARGDQYGYLFVLLGCLVLAGVLLIRGALPHRPAFASRQRR